MSASADTADAQGVVCVRLKDLRWQWLTASTGKLTAKLCVSPKHLRFCWPFWNSSAPVDVVVVSTAMPD